MTEELGLSRNFIRSIAQSISRQLIDYGRRLPGWVAEGMVAPAAENLQVIDIDVRFRSIVYRDRLEWDVNCLHSSPESFARSTVADLALPQEMEPAIAFTIHQQICKHRVELTPSTSGIKENTTEDVTGPRLSSLQPVDQYEFNAQDWREHRPAAINQ
eukprot:jgi/Undpi1/6451/HiC_scaffold_20.g08931.m1